MKRDQWGRPRPFPRPVRDAIIVAALLGSIPIVATRRCIAALAAAATRRARTW